MGGTQSQEQPPPSLIPGASPPLPGLGTQKPKASKKGGDIVVIPIDASKQAETAFLWYARHVHKPENDVRLIHCEELAPTSPIMSEHTFTSTSMTDSAMRAYTDSWLEMNRKAKAAGENLVNQYKQKLEAMQIQGTVETKIGRPGEIVIDVANKAGASHIVMGTRGFGIMRRTILGSVSEYVIHHTSIPVTVVPKETNNWFF